MVSGFFLGGLAQGQQAAQTAREQRERRVASTALQERALDIRNTELGRQAKRQQMADASKAADADLASITQLVDAAVKTGDQQKIQGALKISNELIDSGSRRFAAAGRDPERIKTLLAARAVAAPPTETQRFVAGLKAFQAAPEQSATQEAAVTPVPTPVTTGEPAAVAAPPAAAVPRPSQRTIQAAVSLAETGDVAGARKLIQDDIKAQTQTRTQSETLQAEQTLRKEFLQQSKTFIEVRDAFERAQNIGATAIGDIALIFAFMKAIDPRSTVREGEAATVEQARSVPRRILNLYNRAVTGKRLEPDQRAEIRSEVARAFRPLQRQQVRRNKFYQGLADAQGLSATNVAPDIRSQFVVLPDGSIGEFKR